MEKIFGIIPASSGAFTFLWIFGAVIGLILIGIIGLFVSFGYQAKHATFTVTDQGLCIGPGLYGRTIPKEDIDTEGGRVIDLNLEKEYQPKWRAEEAGVPRHAAGGGKTPKKEKSLVVVT